MATIGFFDVLGNRITVPLVSQNVRVLIRQGYIYNICIGPQAILGTRNYRDKLKLKKAEDKLKKNILQRRNLQANPTVGVSLA